MTRFNDISQNPPSAFANKDIFYDNNDRVPSKLFPRNPDA
jgi:hypothetical protein